MTHQRRAELLLSIVWYGAAIGIVLAAIWFLLPRLTPFLLGTGLAVLIHPAAVKLSAAIHGNSRFSSLAVVLLLLVLAAFLLWGIGLLVWVQAGRMLQHLPELWQQDILPFLQGVGDLFLRLTERFFPGSTQHFDHLGSLAEASLQEWVTTFSSKAMSLMVRWMKKLPLFLVSVLFTLMTVLMVSWDYPKITEFIARQLPPHGVHLLHRIKEILTGSVLRLARAYGLLFLLTLAELSLGLWLLGVDEFFVAALVIAVLDLLPVVGSGLVLGSWSAVVLAGGRFPFGIGLLVLWAIISLVRTFLEPKIVGDQIGLHPLVTLTAMYFGLRSAGVAGMLAVPLMCMIAVRLQADGSLKIYR